MSPYHCCAAQAVLAFQLPADAASAHVAALAQLSQRPGVEQNGNSWARQLCTAALEVLTSYVQAPTESQVLVVASSPPALTHALCDTIQFDILLGNLQSVAANHSSQGCKQPLSCVGSRHWYSLRTQAVSQNKYKPLCLATA